jgi:hypothetical protein
MNPHWIGPLVAFAIAVLLAILLIKLAQPDLASGQAPKSDFQLYQGVPFDATLLRLDRRALEEAYHQQLINLFTVWLKGQAGDPTYFQNGLSNARRAYNQAAGQIAKREQQLLEAEQKPEGK